MTALVAAGCGLIGALLGAVLDVVIRRAGSDVPLDAHLRGTRYRAAVVPGLAAAGCVLVGLRFGATSTVLPFLFFVPLLAELAVVDLHTRRLPNVLTLPALVAGLVLVGGTAAASGSPAVLVDALVAAAVLFVTFLVLALLRPSGMGMGDVKAAAVIGLFVGSLGVGAAVAAIFLAALGALLTTVLLTGAGRIHRGAQTPFGPWLAVGSLVALLAGPELVRVYGELLR
jgi:leader peptidase (prepilin peptidase) / N-methyltransferase